jgi:hypothetical protein
MIGNHVCFVRGIEGSNPSLSTRLRSNELRLAQPANELQSVAWCPAKRLKTKIMGVNEEGEAWALFRNSFKKATVSGEASAKTEDGQTS